MVDFLCASTGGPGKRRGVELSREPEVEHRRNAICVQQAILDRGVMNHISPTVQLPITILLLLCLAFSRHVASHEADHIHSAQSGFSVAGVALGTDFDSAFKIHPTASVQREVASCYNFGQAIILRAHQTLRIQESSSVLTLDFEPSGAASRLYRIHYDRIIDRSADDVRVLLDGLSARYGPHSRKLYRRKMEPAGRIVGFEWQQHDGATLRAELRREYRNGSDDIHLSLLARLPVSGPDRFRHTKSPNCGKR